MAVKLKESFTPALSVLRLHREVSDSTHPAPKSSSELFFLRPHSEKNKWRNFAEFEKHDIKSDFLNWDSVSYLCRFLQEYESFQAELSQLQQSPINLIKKIQLRRELYRNFYLGFRTMLEKDFRSVGDEFLLRLTEIDPEPYKLSVEHDEGPGYGDSIALIAKHLVEKLASLDEESSRAEAERHNSAAVVTWARDFVTTTLKEQLTKIVPTNVDIHPTAISELTQKLRQHLQKSEQLHTQVNTWFSPPGEPPTYPGTSSKYDWNAQERFPSMFYMFHIQDVDFEVTYSQQTKKPEVILHGITLGYKILVGRPNYQQIIDIQTELGKEPLIHSETTSDADIIRNIIPISFEQADQKIPFSAGENSTKLEHIFNYLRSEFYKTRQEWHLGPEHSPQLKDQDRFLHQADAIFDKFYFSQAQRLFTQIARKTIANPNFIYTPQAKKIISKLDAAYGHMESSLKMYVYTNDQNQKSREVMTEDLEQKQRLFAREGIRLDFTPQDEVKIHKVEQLYRLYVKKRIEKQELNLFERWWLKNNMGATLWMLAARADLFHCTTGGVLRLITEGLNKKVRMGDYLISPGEAKNWKYDPKGKCGNPDCKTPDCKQFSKHCGGWCAECVGLEKVGFMDELFGSSTPKNSFTMHKTAEKKQPQHSTPDNSPTRIFSDVTINAQQLLSGEYKDMLFTA